MIIPARLASTRLPRKLLLAETGKPLIRHTYEAVMACSRPVDVIVATDSQEIADIVRGFGGDARMTRIDHPSGTDRVAEVAQTLDAEIIVNVQGDEPEISPAAIDQVASIMEVRLDAIMATLACPIRSVADLHDPACVKVVCDPERRTARPGLIPDIRDLGRPTVVASSRARYFSRCPIPFTRGQPPESLINQEPPVWLRHIGIYAYRRNTLLSAARLQPSRLEQLEQLEQLRILESGGSIEVGMTECHVRGIDTRADYDQFVFRQTGRTTGL